MGPYRRALRPSRSPSRAGAMPADVTHNTAWLLKPRHGASIGAPDGSPWEISRRGPHAGRARHPGAFSVNMGETGARAVVAGPTRERASPPQALV
jgi:hypothetical protein